MRKFLGFLLLTFVATALFAADGDAAQALIEFSPQFSMAIAAGICGLAQARGIGAACEGIARNPGAAGDIRTTMIIGLALIESLALYTLVVVFAI